MSLNGKIYYGNTLVSNPIDGDTIITSNGIYDVGSYEYAMVQVGDEQSDVPINDVNFYDYNGTHVYSYSAAAFANLSALPANPGHVGLTAQGWNWTLSAAKTYVATYGMLNIGQNYTTDNGTTRLYLHNASSANIVYRVISGSSNISVDWGDGTTTSNYVTSSSSTHNYSTVGDYTITITVPNDITIAFGYYTSKLYGNIIGKKLSGSSQYDFTLEKVEIGERVVGFLPGCFVGCGALKSVSIPTSLQYIVTSFYGDGNLKTIVFPLNLSGVGNNDRGNTLELPMFWGCSSLKTVCIHEGYYSMYYDNLFGTGSTSASSTYNAFYKCNSMESIALNSANVTRPYSFCYCDSLSRVSLGPTSSVSGFAFQNCRVLESITIPNNVVTMASSDSPVIKDCALMKKLIMISQYPPSLNSSTIISNSVPIPDVMKIYIPSAALSRYQSASGWNVNTSRFVTY